MNTPNAAQVETARLIVARMLEHGEAAWEPVAQLICEHDEQRVKHCDDCDPSFMGCWLGDEPCRKKPRQKRNRATLVRAVEESGVDGGMATSDAIDALNRFDAAEQSFIERLAALKKTGYQGCDLTDSEIRGIVYDLVDDAAKIINAC